MNREMLIALRERDEALANAARLREALVEALHHAKRCWFSGRTFEDGTEIEHLTIETFNEVQDRLFAETKR